MSTLTDADLKVLKAPFPRDRLGVKVQTVKQGRALLVLYLGHTDVQDRIEQVDPAWVFEILEETPRGDSVEVRARMIVKGIARENVGEGQDSKAAYSDALKRCAMLFGVGRYLYDSSRAWVDYDEKRDKWRQWTIEDYERATGQQGEPAAAPAPAAPPVQAQPRNTRAKPAAKARAAAPAQTSARVFAKTAAGTQQVAGPRPAPAPVFPQCHGQPMEVSGYNPNKLYCRVCKVKTDRPPSRPMPNVGRGN